jgi:hypothetical protein
MRLAGVAAFLVLCLAAAGCGGGGSKTKTTAKPKPVAGSCVNAKAVAKLRADVAAIRSAADKPTHNRLLGNPAINKATDRFLYDVATVKIDNKRRNRMIDFAMGALANQCEQCFQALEAGRPIPSLRYGDTGCGA